MPRLRRARGLADGQGGAAEVRRVRLLAKGVFKALAACEHSGAPRLISCTNARSVLMWFEARYLSGTARLAKMTYDRARWQAPSSMAYARLATHLNKPAYSRLGLDLVLPKMRHHMMNTPTVAAHYYLPEFGPFKSLSRIPGGRESAVFKDLLTRHQRDAGYRRRFGQEYIARRLETERALRALFVERGGKPQSDHPFYLTLGPSPWFKGLNDTHREVLIPLSKLPVDATSLTYPDSFMTVSRPDRPYYNQVFFLNEITQIVDQFGLPKNDNLIPYDKYWETDFELYIEIQLWAAPESLLST